jgi:hemerythrin
MLIDPALLPHLAVPFMNEDHVEEARLLNAAGDAVEALLAGRAGADAVKAALEALYIHTRAHFAREESAMLDASFPAYTFHQADHVRTLGEMGEAERKFRESGKADDLSAYLATVPDWLRQHIETMDTVTARYVAEWGG